MHLWSYTNTDCENDQRFAKAPVKYVEDWGVVYTSPKWTETPKAEVRVTPDLDTKFYNRSLVSRESAFLMSNSEPSENAKLFAAMVEQSKSVALSIVDKVKSELIVAAFDHRNEGIEFIIRNPHNGRQAYIEVAPNRRDAWVHMVSASEALDETSSVYDTNETTYISMWLNG